MALSMHKLYVICTSYHKIKDTRLITHRNIEFTDQTLKILYISNVLQNDSIYKQSSNMYCLFTSKIN